MVKLHFLSKCPAHLSFRGREIFWFITLKKNPSIRTLFGSNSQKQTQNQAKVNKKNANIKFTQKCWPENLKKKKKK